MMHLNESASGSYTIAGGDEGKQRLNQLAEILRPTTLQLLEDAGLRPGHRCVDLGSGGGDVTFDMARVVGREGSVTGVDSDERIIELAREDAKRAGHANVEFRVADAGAFRDGRFDLVYARLLLSHSAQPEQMLAQMRQLAKPGGRVVIEDTDLSGQYCYPDNPAFTRFRDLYSAVVRAGGGDPDIGRRLPVLATTASLRDIRWHVFQPVHISGPSKRISEATLERIRPALVSRGLATDQEIDALLADMASFVRAPSTLVALPRIVQVWGTV
jgi:SAM-dependent methyltransferase